jgi:hypothetical protein
VGLMLMEAEPVAWAEALELSDAAALAVTLALPVTLSVAVSEGVAEGQAECEGVEAAVLEAVALAPPLGLPVGAGVQVAEAVAEGVGAEEVEGARLPVPLGVAVEQAVEEGVALSPPWPPGLGVDSRLKEMPVVALEVALEEAALEAVAAEEGEPPEVPLVEGQGEAVRLGSGEPETEGSGVSEAVEVALRVARWLAEELALAVEESVTRALVTVCVGELESESREGEGCPLGVRAGVLLALALGVEVGEVEEVGDSVPPTSPPAPSVGVEATLALALLVRVALALVVPAAEAEALSVAAVLSVAVAVNVTMAALEDTVEVGLEEGEVVPDAAGELLALAVKELEDVEEGQAAREGVGSGELLTLGEPLSTAEGVTCGVPVALMGLPLGVEEEVGLPV